MSRGLGAFASATVAGFEAVFPDISNVFSVGKSVEGRELWVMRIGKDDGDINKPEFKYIANMHGDEVMLPWCVTDS